MTAALGVVALALLVACSAPTTTEPSLGTVNFSPRLVVDIGPAGLRFRAGPREDPDLRLDPASTRSGTVTEVTNTSARDHRLQGNDGTTFDTGVLRPGEKTTVVLTNTTAGDQSVRITDPTDPAIDATIVVRPAPAAG